MSRGTRPTQPGRWPRTQEDRRLEAEDTGKEIVSLTRKAQDHLEAVDRTTNQYEQKVYKAKAERILSDIAALGERIARLMVEAKIGADLEPKEEAQ